MQNLQAQLHRLHPGLPGRPGHTESLDGHPAGQLPRDPVRFHRHRHQAEKGRHREARAGVGADQPGRRERRCDGEGQHGNPDEGSLPQNCTPTVKWNR